jgi:hypothetical protein
MMIGEHRPPVAELLWDKADSLISTLDYISPEERSSILSGLKELKTHEDIFTKAKQILKGNSDHNSQSSTDPT